MSASGLIFDVGAHRGEDSAFYLRKGFRVVAVEADAGLAAQCRRRFAAEAAAGRFALVEGAIVDPHSLAPGQRTIRFHRNLANSVWGTVRDDWAARNARLGAPSEEVEVAVVDLAAVIREYGVPHYMKIDIEGADDACLGALAHFRSRPKYVSLESDKTSFAGVRAEVRALSELGYRSFQVVEQSAIPSTVLSPPAREGTFIEHRFEEGASGPFGADLAGDWLSESAVLRRLRAIRLGYWLLGDEGVMNRWRFRGAGRLRRWTARLLEYVTHGIVPGWHDLHARHGE